MDSFSFKILEKKIIIKIKDRICETSDEMLSSRLFRDFVKICFQELIEKESPLLTVFQKPINEIGADDINCFVEVIKMLTKMPLASIPKLIENAEGLVADKERLNDLIEHLYNFWRGYERFMICRSKGSDLDKRPYRTFNKTVESLTRMVRSIYRDLQENVLGQHPNIYRQVRAGAEISTIAFPRDLYQKDSPYEKLNPVSIIRQMLIYPPLILNPPMNKRTGKFERVDRNPLDLVNLDSEEWLCYPAKVGSLLIMIYFHEKFFELGFSLCNLFELADDEFMKRKPDAVYLFGVPGEALYEFSAFPTVFYEDTANDCLVAAVPNKDDFGYFGYLKKMVLTLFNIKMMKAEKMPYHGAMVNILLKGNKSSTILIIGDTGAGKSETLEAFRTIGGSEIEEITIIADDMGSLDIDENGEIIGYGTEIGAFVRLDDLQPGYAFGQIDRTIIMNPNQTNARVIIPVTNYNTIIKGYKVDYILYANNYEEVDEDHPLIEQINSSEKAFETFKEGTAMSKGTTTSTGLVHTYFVNIFGAVQYKQEHDQIAKRYFEAFYQEGVFVGQLRTRLGIDGWERKGPEEAAIALLKLLAGKAD